MKKGKANLITDLVRYLSMNLLVLVLLAAAIFIVLVLIKRVEPFQAGTVILHYGIGSDLKPIFLSSSNPAVTPGTSAVGIATVNLNSTLGTLKSYTGFGWSSNKWSPLAAAKLDRGAGSLFLASGGKTIHNPTYTAPMSPLEVKLSATGLSFTTLTMNNLNTSTFPVQGAGDNANKNSAGVKAKIRIHLTF